MASNLYETLDLSRNATPEDVRKAYRKHALKSHPDRLPQGATEDQKKVAEERFRQVNNAYEVLNDPEKRKVYDIHGVFPAPTTPTEAPRFHHHRSGGGHSRSYDSRHRDPFMRNDGFPNFPFTDPFRLFEEVFPEMFSGGSSGRRGQFGRDGVFPDPFGRGFPAMPLMPRMPMMMPLGMRSPFAGFESPFEDMNAEFLPDSDQDRNTHWVTERMSSRTINGVTETFRERVDSNGNKHVERTKNGRRTLHINGVEQPTEQSAPRRVKHDKHSRPQNRIEGRDYRDDIYYPHRRDTDHYNPAESYIPRHDYADDDDHRERHHDRHEPPAQRFQKQGHWWNRGRD